MSHASQFRFFITVTTHTHNPVMISGIREKLSKHPNWAAGVSTLVIGIAIVIAVRSSSSSGNAPYVVNTFFSSDDGASYFAGTASDTNEMMRRSPPAYIARVYSCGNQKFVAYLSRTPLESVKEMEAFIIERDAKQKALSASDPNYNSKMDALIKKEQAMQNRAADAVELKRPGASNQWVKANSPAGQEIINNIKCPGGGTDVPMPILP